MRSQLAPCWTTIAVAILLALSVEAAPGQGVAAKAPAAPPSRLHGRVLDRKTKAGIPFAQVILDADGRSVTSDSAGRYDIPGMPNGVVSLTVRHANFAVGHYTLELIGTGSWDHDMELDSAGTEATHIARLAAVAVTATAPRSNSRMFGFELRRATGRGQYLTDAEIRKSGASNIQDAVRNMRGVDLDCSGTLYAGCRIRMARAPERCLPEYYVDGQHDNSFGPSTPIRDVVGIEVYTGPAELPGEFAGTNSGCGVIALWTRSGPDRRSKSKEPKDPGGP